MTVNHHHLTNDLGQLSILVIENIEIFLEYFKLDYTRSKRNITLCCPIHGGDNPTGLVILADGVGNWQCYTNQCHKKYGNTKGSSILSLLHALRLKEKEESFGDTVQWVANLLKLDKVPQTTKTDADKKEFIKLCADNKIIDSHIHIDKQLLLDSLVMPPDYYLTRNFSKAILNKYYVGYCNRKNKFFYDRVVVPYFSHDFKFVIGCQGRSVHPQCHKCNAYHDLGRQCCNSKQESPKWITQYGFYNHNFLYNFWSARDHITRTKTAILVEGASDVWRLEECGIRNAVGLGGAIFQPEQRKLIETCGVFNLILLTDNDKAGINCANIIKKEYGRYFNIYHINQLPTKDVGEMLNEQVNQLIIPKLLELQGTL